MKKTQIMNYSKRIVFAILIGCLFAIPVGARGAAQTFPIPQTVSPEVQKLIAARPASYWNAHPANIQEWKTWVSRLAKEASKELPQ